MYKLRKIQNEINMNKEVNMKKIIIVVIVIYLLTTGCKNSTDPKVDPLALTFTISHVSHIDSSDGSIGLSVNGGLQPYSYNWSNDSTSEDISNLSIGIYTVIVTDADGKVKSDSVEISDGCIYGTITDIDGNIYNTVKIGDQWWMSENLKVTHDAQGNSITSNIYNNNSANEETYGRLYTWNVVMNGSTVEGAQGIAPEGWHIPNDGEWQALFDYLGGIGVAGGEKVVEYKENRFYKYITENQLPEGNKYCIFYDSHGQLLKYHSQ